MDKNKMQWEIEDTIVQVTCLSGGVMCVSYGIKGRLPTVYSTTSLDSVISFIRILDAKLHYYPGSGIVEG
jgi:spore coat protein CotH